MASQLAIYADRIQAQIHALEKLAADLKQTAGEGLPVDSRDEKAFAKFEGVAKKMLDRCDWIISDHETPHGAAGLDQAMKQLAPEMKLMFTEMLDSIEKDDAVLFTKAQERLPQIQTMIDAVFVPEWDKLPGDIRKAKSAQLKRPFDPTVPRELRQK